MGVREELYADSFICGLFCDKRLIPCFRRCDIFCNMPHSKNTPSSRFSSKYPGKLCGVVGEIGSIFHWHSVVGNNTYSINTKMGGRTSLFLTSQRMPSRYVLRLQVYIIIKFWHDTHKADSQIN